jgi:PncC family amidohydrolase
VPLTGNIVRIDTKSLDGEEPLNELVGPRQLAIAESCTGGLLAARVVAVPGSGEWLRGGIVAYQSSVKFDLLAVSPGPVVNARAAKEMATGVAKLFGAEIGIATTGVAGPDSQDGAPVGTVWIAHAFSGGAWAKRYQFVGGPDTIRAAAVEAAITQLTEALRETSTGTPTGDANRGGFVSDMSGNN